MKTQKEIIDKIYKGKTSDIYERLYFFSEKIKSKKITDQKVIENIVNEIIERNMWLWQDLLNFLYLKVIKDKEVNDKIINFFLHYKKYEELTYLIKKDIITDKTIINKISKGLIDKRNWATLSFIIGKKYIDDPEIINKVIDDLILNKYYALLQDLILDGFIKQIKDRIDILFKNISKLHELTLNNIGI